MMQRQSHTLLLLLLSLPLTTGILFVVAVVPISTLWHAPAAVCSR